MLWVGDSGTDEKSGGGYGGGRVEQYQGRIQVLRKGVPIYLM